MQSSMIRSLKDCDIQQYRQEYEKLKRELERKIQEVEGELALQKQALMVEFDSGMRRREHEFNLRIDEMSNVIFSHELKVKRAYRILSCLMCRHQELDRFACERDAVLVTVKEAGSGPGEEPQGAADQPGDPGNGEAETGVEPRRHLEGERRAAGKTMAEHLEKEQELQDMNVLVRSVTLERDRSMAALRKHGFHSERETQGTGFEQGVLTKGDFPSEEIRRLQQQNSRLRAVIAEMRKEMETLSELIPASPKTYKVPRRASAFFIVFYHFYRVVQKYIRSLEDEVKELKEKCRQQEEQLEETLKAPRKTPDPFPGFPVSADNAYLQNHTHTLSETIGGLRAEKFSIATTLKKQEARVAQQEPIVTQLTQQVSALKLDIASRRAPVLVEQNEMVSQLQEQILQLRQQLYVSGPGASLNRYEKVNVQTLQAKLKQVTTEKMEDIVIAGISGRLPESDNLEEFWENLINGVDMVTEDDRRWKPGLYGLPRRNGKLKEISKFDASFFGVHPKQAHTMDPQLRLMMEISYEAIVDGGINPVAMRGSNTGVYIGVSGSEAAEAFSRDPEELLGYSMTGCQRAMFANRLSYFFDFNGPSTAIDTACSSSLLALENAFQAIRHGQCDSALVGGVNLLLKPNTSVQFMKLGMLSPGGSCKSFDASGDGYCRSEAAVAVLLTKRSMARRVYATVLNAGNNTDGYKEQGVTFPSGEMQQRLVRSLYQEARIAPEEVEYIEAHGTGTKVGDPQEVNGIVGVFCQTEREPLLIGSTKSNMGHPEPASGLAALAKVVLSLEHGLWAPNIHYNTPNTDIPALTDGRLRVVSEPIPVRGGIVGINSFGFGGSNVHVILRPPSTHPLRPSQSLALPRLLQVCGRTEEAVSTLIQQGRNHADDATFLSMLNEVSAVPTAAMPYRGYALIGSESDITEIQQSQATPRPLWYICSGMGTQWAGMGRSLMQLTEFRESILRSDQALRDTGLQVSQLLMEADDSTFEDTVHAFVGLAAIQIAQIDMLSKLGLQPDGIVGHSVGELACGYADGSLSHSEAVLAAYWRGRSIKEAKLPPGGMAAVGLTWEECKAQCPEGVVPACHNAEDTVTISGPQESVSQFVAKLKEEGVFAKEVRSAGVAFHSYYMASIAPSLLDALKKVIKNPKERSPRWISTSIPQSNWDSPLARLSSAEYHVNNLVSPVLFQEGLNLVPDNAVVVEIAPHALLQAILKRSLKTTCSILPLMKRGHANNLEFFLSHIGKVYMSGIDVDCNKLYPPVEYPAPIGTPLISPHIVWDHSQTWDVPSIEHFPAGSGGSSSATVYNIDMNPESPDSYMIGHCIDGRVLYPATGYLVLAWRTLMRTLGAVMEQTPVMFEDVTIHRATILPKTGSVQLEVRLMPASNKFEVSENGNLAVSGKVSLLEEAALNNFRNQMDVPPEGTDCNPKLRLTSSEIYKELRLRGYDYGKTFQGILESNNTGDRGKLLWSGNWVTFLDTMLQMIVVGLSGRSLRLPTRIRSVCVDPRLHEERVRDHTEDKKVVDVVVNHCLDNIVAGGVQICGLHATVAPRRQQQQTPPTLEEFRFVPYVETECLRGSEKLRARLGQCKGLILKLQRKLSQQGVKLSIPGLEQVAGGESVSQSGKGLLHLLSVLCGLELNGNLHSELEQTVERERGCLGEDPLLNGLLDSAALRVCLDTALENSSPGRMKILEVLSSDGRLFSRIVPLLNIQPMLQLDYTATDLTSDLLTAHQSDLEALGVSVAQWDPSSGPAPGNLGGMDLLVCNSPSSPLRNPSNVISNLASAVKEGGFVLLHTLLKGDTLGETISFLTTHNQEQGLLSQTKWEEVFSQASLHVVAMKRSFYGSAIFLCRRQAPEKVPIFLPVDGADYKWVEHLKSTLAEPSDHSVWLTASSCGDSGIVGMVNCLKQEPGGNRIRDVDRYIQETGVLGVMSAAYKLTKLTFKTTLVVHFRPKELPAENGECSTEAKPCSKRSLEDEEENPEFLSKNKLKKKAQNPHRNFDLAQKPKYAKCEQCGNPKNFL
ncbi:Fatty acid synthase [Acipenser ruthenus]|uniref:Fatty acid synthase n=1 Tax=Acipenser ruthenus TaxID=7906 RepID=A0A444UF88_ACIRT|nr:Fatty acid synthase [Acipenser ruthenus]